MTPRTQINRGAGKSTRLEERHQARRLESLGLNSLARKWSRLPRTDAEGEWVERPDLVTKGLRPIDERRARNTRCAAKRIRMRENKKRLAMAEEIERIIDEEPNNKVTRTRVNEIKKQIEHSRLISAGSHVKKDPQRNKREEIMPRAMLDKIRREQARALGEASKTWKVITRYLKNKDDYEGAEQLWNGLSQQQRTLLGPSHAEQYGRLYNEAMKRRTGATQSKGWLRDLTREGVEPNPGPCTCRRDPETCQQHRLRQAGGRRGRLGACFNCGSQQHIFRDCPQPRRPNVVHPARRAVRENAPNRPREEPRQRRGANNDAAARNAANAQDVDVLMAQIDVLREQLADAHEEPLPPYDERHEAAVDGLAAPEDRPPAGNVAGAPPPAVPGDPDGEPPQDDPTLPADGHTVTYTFYTAGHAGTRLIDVINPRYARRSPYMTAFGTLSTLVFLWSSFFTLRRIWLLIGMIWATASVASDVLLTLSPPYSTTELIWRTLMSVLRYLWNNAAMGSSDLISFGCICDAAVLLAYIYFVGSKKIAFTKHTVTEKILSQVATGNFPTDFHFSAAAKARKPDDRLLEITHSQQRCVWGEPIPVLLSRILGDDDAGTNTWRVRSGDIMRTSFIPADFALSSWNQLRRSVGRMLNAAPLVNGDAYDARLVAQVSFLRNCRNFSDNYSTLKSTFVDSLGDSAPPQAP